MEGADTKTNNDLTDDYRSLTQKYKELQAKFRHFEVADSNKYDDVWAMHEDEVKSLVDQLLKADKIIAEQQLGWQWKGPDMNALQIVLGRHGSNLLALAAGATATATAAQVREKQKEMSAFWPTFNLSCMECCWSSGFVVDVSFKLAVISSNRSPPACLQCECGGAFPSLFDILSLLSLLSFHSVSPSFPSPFLFILLFSFTLPVNPLLLLVYIHIVF